MWIVALAVLCTPFLLYLALRWKFEMLFNDLCRDMLKGVRYLAENSKKSIENLDTFQKTETNLFEVIKKSPRSYAFSWKYFGPPWLFYLFLSRSNHYFKIYKHCERLGYMLVMLRDSHESLMHILENPKTRVNIHRAEWCIVLEHFGCFRGETAEVHRLATEIKELCEQCIE